MVGEWPAVSILTPDCPQKRGTTSWATRSIVGTLDPETGEWDGRYVHWDGSPSTRVPVLARALAMYDGGLDRLLTDLLAAEWSSLDPKDGVLGEAYPEEPTARAGVLGGPGDMEEWGFFFTSRDPGAAELVVVAGEWGDAGPGVPVEVGRVKVTELHKVTEDQVARIECGERFERCCHYAWVHFPEAQGQRTSTAEWLAAHPLDA